MAHIKLICSFIACTKKTLYRIRIKFCYNILKLVTCIHNSIDTIPQLLKRYCWREYKFQWPQFLGNKLKANLPTYRIYSIQFDLFFGLADRRCDQLICAATTRCCFAALFSSAVAFYHWSCIRSFILNFEYILYTRRTTFVLTGPVASGEKLEVIYFCVLFAPYLL